MIWWLEQTWNKSLLYSNAEGVRGALSEVLTPSATSSLYHSFAAQHANTALY